MPGKRCLVPEALHTRAPLFYVCLAAWCQQQHSRCVQVASVAICATQPCHNTVLATFWSLVCRVGGAWHEAFTQPLQISNLCVLCNLMPLPAKRRVQAHGLARYKHHVNAVCSTSLPGCRLHVLWTLMSPSSSPFPQRSSSITLRPSALMRWCCTCATMTRWGPVTGNSAEPHGLTVQPCHCLHQLKHHTRRPASLSGGQAGASACKELAHSPHISQTTDGCVHLDFVKAVHPQHEPLLGHTVFAPDCCMPGQAAWPVIAGRPQSQGGAATH